MKKAKIILNIIIILFTIPIIISGILILKNRPTVIIPNESINEKTYEIIDKKSNNGNSKIIKNEIREKEIYFEYILNEGYKYPFAGLGIKLGSDEMFTDLSSYKYLKIELNTTLKRKYRISIKTNNLDPDKTNKSEKYRTLVNFIEAPGGDAEFKLSLSNFETPAWWMSKNKYKKYASDQEALKEVFAMDIMDIKNYPFNSTENHGIIIIKNIHLYKSNYNLYPLLLTSILLFILLIISRFIIPVIFSTQKNIHQQTQEYKKIKLSNYEEINFSKINSYINTNYYKPDISINDIQKETGITVKKIASIIKKKYNLSFKQLINQIRIKESKRLLIETDRDITEIAFHLGFNSLPYFYQVFKEQEKMSPRKFRKENKI